MVVAVTTATDLCFHNVFAAAIDNNTYGAMSNFKVGKEIAVTFDDLPNDSVFDSNKKDPVKQLRQRHDKILRALKKYNINAIGFINEIGLYDKDINGNVSVTSNPMRVALLQMWLEAGQELGNHTYAHVSLNKVPLVDYEKNVLDGEKIFAPLAKKFGKPPRYFRHPFLHTGRTLQIHADFAQFLHQHGYTIAPVTVDTDDWMFNIVYTKAKQLGDKKKMARLKKEYIAHTAAKFYFYEKVSQQLFNRPIRHIWLLHAMDIDADCADALFALAKKHGYKFITVDEALEDPVYNLPDNYTGPAGVAWLFHWDYSGNQQINWRKEPNPSGEVGQAGHFSY